MSQKVVDSSAVVAMLTDAGPDGRWATAELRDATELMAPALMPFEVDNILRRHELAGLLSRDQAAQAHADLVAFDVVAWPHEVVADRIWGLRSNLTAYDASYVALGELLDAPLVTLDDRIGRASGHRCEVRTPAGG